jgi:hypothetical protein
MADPVTPASETPNQPKVETPASAPASVATPAPSATTPEIQSAVSPAPEAKVDPKPTAAEGSTPQPVGDDAAKALADAAKAAADKAAADAATAVPEVKYEIKAPEGVSVDPAFITALTPSLKKAGISNEQLQTIAEGYLQFQQGLPAAILERDLAITAKDPAIGGMRYGQTLKEVNLAIEAFGDPDFKKFVAQAGIGNRLEFVRVFQRIGEAMARAGDTPARGQPDAGAETTIAQRLYGRTKSNS